MRDGKNAGHGAIIRARQPPADDGSRKPARRTGAIHSLEPKTVRKAQTMADDVETTSIDRYRQEIDEIDTELLRMLNRRAACAMEIGKIKKRNNQPIHVPEREEEVLKRLISLNGGPVPAESVEAVFQSIFAQMRALEEDSD